MFFLVNVIVNKMLIRDNDILLINTFEHSILLEKYIQEIIFEL